MARPLRIEYAGACYHVINRGNYRRNLFDRGGAEAFERVLDEAARRFGWRVHAYVIMRNHYHMAVEIAEPDLSEGMKWPTGQRGQAEYCKQRQRGQAVQMGPGKRGRPLNFNINIDRTFRGLSKWDFPNGTFRGLSDFPNGVMS
jgi:putative transposase